MTAAVELCASPGRAGAEGGQPMSPSPVPDRSLVQRMEALDRANEVRVKRAALKRDLKAGRASIHVVLLAPPEYLENAKVFDILLAVPKYGRTKVHGLLTGCRISLTKTIGGLSERQRAELVSLIQEPAPTGRHRGRPSEDDLTHFEIEVLDHACDLGSVSGSNARYTAINLHTLVSRVSLARGSLVRRGMLDELGQPTSDGRAKRDELLTAAA